ncbi:MAG: hypothetical protein KDE22_08640 [Rhodobacterales bacterium]|nr:hypothetical protein [Rhodobacterales bacterium]
MIAKILNTFRQMREAHEAAKGYRESPPRPLLAEVAAMARARQQGFTPEEYYEFGLDAGRNWDWVGNVPYYQLVRRLNPPAGGVIPFNKWMFSQYFSSVGIPVPLCHGVFHPETGFLRDGSPFTGADDLRKLLADKGPSVLKPMRGQKGIGVMVVDSYDGPSDQVTYSNGKAESFDGFFAQVAAAEYGYLIQEKVRQHPVLDGLNHASVNAVRVVTMLAEPPRVDIIGAYLRVGTGSRMVDNYGARALVNLETGEVGEAIDGHLKPAGPNHPDSGIRIAGTIIPHWDKVLADACRAHRFLPFVRSLGWDIAVNADGPVFLETNGSWDHKPMQALLGKSLMDTAYGVAVRASGGH